MTDEIDHLRAQCQSLDAEAQAVADFCGNRLGTDPTLRRPAIGVCRALVTWLDDEIDNLAFLLAEAREDAATNLEIDAAARRQLAEMIRARAKP